VLLEWKFESPEEWSWQFPITSAAYLVGPFMLLVLGPLLIAAILTSRWISRRFGNAHTDI
jgi:hypothetical protein